MKKISFTAVLCVLLTFLFVVPAVADRYASDVTLSMQINNPIMEVNGKNAEIDPGRGTVPIIINGRTLVPVRAIIEAFEGSVTWDGDTRAVLLDVSGDKIKLVIDSKIAYFNNKACELDVAPVILDGRTMLPIRFIAESFNFGVAWDGKTQTVSIIRDSLSQQEYEYLVGILPQYSGQAYTYINNNTPFFKDYEIIEGSFEYYNTLDYLGRCDVCVASVAEDIMPVEKRESISSVKPTGWINKSYDVVDGGYLYNRCHLIGYQLTGENANERNLITGTRYMNVEGMLPFENMVDDYIEKTKNHVMYRVTPVFINNNLVANGVLIEAYSVEDNGRGISFCVYCYNVQPSIYINYATGESSFAGSTENKVNEKNVYRTPSGKRYHYDAGCGGQNSYSITLDEAVSSGLTPCQKCAK